MTDADRPRGRGAGLRWPSSYQGRFALMIAAAILVVTVGVQGVIRGVVNQRVRDEAQQTLLAQAQALADSVGAAQPSNRNLVASDATRYLPNTKIKVSPGIFENIVREKLDISATARSGSVTVRLERASAGAGLEGWLVVALYAAGLAVTAALVWGLASALARRLRRQVADLAASAEAVAAGDLSARAAVSHDELGRAAAAFNTMARRLAEADERQKRFLADIAHELRTPVTAIEGFAESLADGTARTEADRTEALSFVRDEAARLRELIAELRELTWLDLDPPPRFRRFGIDEALDAALARFAAAAAAAGVALTGPQEGPLVETDPAHVETIVSNLVANAIAATPSGGSVAVAVRADGPEAVITVTDTGIGIAAEHLPHVFDRLYRVDTSRSRDQGGSGLGLAIVKRLCEVLGGGVVVQSAPGRGSTFTVRLPGVVAGAPASRRPDSSRTSAGVRAGSAD